MLGLGWGEYLREAEDLAGQPGCNCLRPEERAAQAGEAWTKLWKGKGMGTQAGREQGPFGFFPCFSLGRMGRQGPQREACVCVKSPVVLEASKMRNES